MKNILLTTAALLVAGTSFANAEDYSGTFSWGAQTTTPTFTFSDSKGLFSVELSTSATYKNTSYEQGTFTPDVNVGNGGTWTLDFTFTNNSGSSYTFDGITLEAFTFNAGGTTQSDNTNRTVVFTLSGGVTGETTKTIEGKKSGSLTSLPLVATPFTVSANDKVQFSLKVERAPSETNGTFVGLKGATFSTSAIPEPSAFGLLAGIGALSLVASRRRRSR